MLQQPDWASQTGWQSVMTQVNPLLGTDPPILEAADSCAEGLWKRVPDESDSPDLSCDTLPPRSVKRVSSGPSMGLILAFIMPVAALECWGTMGLPDVLLIPKQLTSSIL